MGNTIRRKPISFKIPKKPNYEFLNIVDFKGLDITDNPFTAKSNTASDLLNVYVDESNSLTTRPRLYKNADIISLLINKFGSGTYSIVGVYSLDSGYLIHFKESSTYYMIKMSDSFVLNSSPVSVEDDGTQIPTKKCKVFQDNNTIYVLGDSKYCKIYNNIISRVDGYIPTTIEGKTLTQNGTEFEELNLFSNKYKESYFWDGTWNTDTILTSADDNVENKTEVITKALASYTWGEYRPLFTFLYDKKSQEHPEYQYFLSRTQRGGQEQQLVFCHVKKGDDEVIYPSVNTDSDLLTSPATTLPDHRNYLYGDATPDGKTVVWCYVSNGNYDGTNGGLFVNRNGVNYTLLCSVDDNFYVLSTDKRYSFVRISDDGNVILSATSTHVIVCRWNESTSQYVVTKIAYNTTTEYCIGVEMSSDGSTLLIKYRAPYYSGDIKSYTTLSCAKGVTLSNTITFRNIIAPNDTRFTGLAVSKDGNYLAYGLINSSGSDEKESLVLYKSFNTDNTSTNIDLQAPFISSTDYVFSKDLDKLYFYDNRDNCGWIMLDTDTEIDFNFDTSNTNVNYNKNVFENSKPYATTNSIFIQSHRLSAGENVFYSILSNINFNVMYPTVYITKTLNAYDNRYENWNKERTNLFQSTLMCRFDNNYWFGGYKNNIYYTSNNDPTRIEITNRDTLGESVEKVTSFSIVQDDTLIAYKDVKLFIISKAYDSSGSAYFITSESKNTIGNNAIDGSIVTTLTETPIQIAYDGIYALNQLKNVQSSDRISTIISTQINKKWLGENKSAITNCKTFNRLYWTYIVLNDNDDYSKIYLLDNRTLSWYYWEIPIKVLDCYNKNNKSIFVGSDGKLYELRTTDIHNEYNPDMTEYYDDDKKIINWYWQSQILPFGTINYSKRLISTTFVVTDTDNCDEYGLNYLFKTYRKDLSETSITTISNKLNYVQSITKKTTIPRYDFAQLKISNISSGTIDTNINDSLNNNKLKLVGIGFKYTLLEGLK